MSQNEWNQSVASSMEAKIKETMSGSPQAMELPVIPPLPDLGYEGGDKVEEYDPHEFARRTAAPNIGNALSEVSEPALTATGEPDFFGDENEGLPPLPEIDDIKKADHLTQSMMATEMRNPIVIYHGNCADGFSAAWVFHHMGPKMEQDFIFHAGVYGKPPPTDIENRIVYLVDFSYRRDVVKAMCDEALQVVLIDHHKSAIEDLAGLEDELVNFEVYCDLERSGAMLAWDYWNNEERHPDGTHTSHRPGDNGYEYPPKLLEHVQDRDLWKFKLPHTREIQAAVFSYEYTFDHWDKLMFGSAQDLLNLTQGGAAIERKHHKDIKELLDVCKRTMVIGGYAVPVASLPYTLASDAGTVLATDHEEGRSFAGTYYDTAEHRCFSLRSTAAGLDVSAIAFSYGGGGHKNAAGFKVPRDHELAKA